MRCYRKILHISCKDHVTNKDLLTIIKRCKLQRYGHASRSSGLAKTTVHARHSERGKKTRQTEEEVGRHQGMDRPGVQQVPEGSGEQGKMEKTRCNVICGAPTTLSLKGLMMMMMKYDSKENYCSMLYIFQIFINGLLWCFLWAELHVDMWELFTRRCLWQGQWYMPWWMPAWVWSFGSTVQGT